MSWRQRKSARYFGPWGTVRNTHRTVNNTHRALHHSRRLIFRNEQSADGAAELVPGSTDNNVNRVAATAPSPAGTSLPTQHIPALKDIIVSIRDKRENVSTSFAGYEQSQRHDLETVLEAKATDNAKLLADLHRIREIARESLKHEDPQAPRALTSVRKAKR